MSVVKGPDNSHDLISQWINTYEKDMLRLCCVYLKDVSLAEDAVQEKFLKAYRHLSSFRGESSPRTWLVRIAINECKAISRSAWFRLWRNAVQLDRLQIAQSDGSHEVRSALVAEIMNLPRPCREVVLLYYYEDFTLAEIARALQVSVPTVHRRLKKACALLKTELKGESSYEA